MDINCAECDRLTAECERLQQQNASGQESFNARVQPFAPGEYAELGWPVEEARMEAEIARFELEQNKEIHRRAK
jgi:hypothetical protein